MQKTLKPRTMFCGDNLPVLRGINSGSIDLIYLDPPFNKGRYFHASIGTAAEGADFSDIWSPSTVKDEWHNEINDRMPKLYKYLDAVGDIGSRSAKYYLVYMAVRLIEMRRILKDSGSIYLHCDGTAGHYLKLLLDTIFGHACFVNEIAWCYHGPGSPKQKQFSRKHDTVFWFSKSEQWAFNADDIRVPYVGGEPHTGGYGIDSDTAKEYGKKGKIPEDWWPIRIAARSSSEYVGYPTQKPLMLLERIIKASSNQGDIVLDPFCGCATTCVAAEKWGRKWIGIDVSAKAYGLVRKRLAKEIPPTLFIPTVPIYRCDIPTRTDLPRKKKPTPKDKQLLYGMQNGNCKGCGQHFTHVRHFHIDHIVPQVHGGSHEFENLQLLCGNCNSIKGSHPMEYLRARIRQLYG